MDKFNSVDEYISSFPPIIQENLILIRQSIKKTAPEAKESISYDMPAYKLNGRILVYFAAFKNHVGFYPLPSSIELFKADLSKYKHAKGSVQFPLNEPMPLELIKRIVKFRKEEVQLGK
jgi:uncharacterized protein YdhG (YjbR/CyaY superfamily)